MKVSRQVASECRGRFQCGVNQATTNKTPLNAHNEDKVMALGEEEWEDLFGNGIESTSFNGYSCESSSQDDININ